MSNKQLKPVLAMGSQELSQIIYRPTSEHKYQTWKVSISSLEENPGNSFSPLESRLLD